MPTPTRRLRAIARTALLWSASWALFVLLVFAVLTLFGLTGAHATVQSALFLALRAGIVGFVAGTAFATFVSFAYRGRRLLQMRAWRFGLVGGLATAIFVPSFLQLMNLLSGDGMVPMAQVLDDGLWTGVLSGIVAAASLKIAQRSRARSEMIGDDPAALAAAEQTPTASELRSRSKVR